MIENDFILLVGFCQSMAQGMADECWSHGFFLTYAVPAS